MNNLVKTDQKKKKIEKKEKDGLRVLYPHTNTNSLTVHHLSPR